MLGVNDVAAAVNTYTARTTYYNRIGAVSLYGDVNSGPFNLALRYVSALQRFSPLDLQTRAVALNSGTGAKPWAADVTAGYKFNAWDKNNNVYVGYQGSQNSVNLFLPKNRWLAGYGVEMWKNTNLGVEAMHDVDYSVADGGTGNTFNTVGFRVQILFS